ncbi:MAG: phosphatidylserine decarboxylase [Alphaproteobacteria bacterium]|nr:phosphatidylserine decarboxylase [Alphaproteobacteria bacterium]
MKAVDISLRRYLFPNINEDGWKFISALALVSIVLAMLWIPLGFLSFLVTILTFYCFRDPQRITPILSDAIVAPADGLVVSISREKGPDALGLGNRNFTRVCIYSSLFDSHINRIPLKGKIHKTFYTEGKNFSDNWHKNDLHNEKAMFSWRNANYELAIQQTALICNKRVINKVKISDEYTTGQRFGFIRYGGYVDLFLPDKIEPQVCIGQQMIAGETIVANIRSDAPRIEGEIR